MHSDLSDQHGKQTLKEERNPKIWVVYDAESEEMKGNVFDLSRVNQYARLRIIACEDVIPEILFHNRFGPYIIYYEGHTGNFNKGGKKGRLMLDKLDAENTGNWQPLFNKYKLDWTYAIPLEGGIAYKAWLSGYRVFAEIMAGRHRVLRAINEATKDLYEPSFEENAK